MEQTVRQLLTLTRPTANDLFQLGVNSQKRKPYTFRRDTRSSEFFAELCSCEAATVTQYAFKGARGLNAERRIEFVVAKSILQCLMDTSGSQLEHPANIFAGNKVPRGSHDVGPKDLSFIESFVDMRIRYGARA
jgi:hypothetical protein